MKGEPAHLHIGRLGEELACRFLEGKGFSICDRNYRKKWGELDIVADDAGLIRFIEVKSVSSWEENSTDIHRPEDNIDPRKVERLKRVIQSYLLSHKKIGKWQFDFVTVKIDEEGKKAKIAFVENVIL